MELERELLAARTELAGIRRILEQERLERKELEIEALKLIKGAKRKWENTDKDKIDELNKQIESQSIRIVELCTNNNEMSLRLQQAESELKTSNAELNKLRVFQVQYKESLEKMRELNRQSAQGIEEKLEQMSTRSHNQLTELRTKLDAEVAKSADLEHKLRREQDSNHCLQSRLNVALEMAQSELRDCQEQLRNLKATIPVLDGEIEELQQELIQKNKRLENAVIDEQTFLAMQEKIERLADENERLKNRSEAFELDFSDTLNLRSKDEILKRVDRDKPTLKLQSEKEEKLLCKVSTLEELLERRQDSIVKLEAENASLKKENENPSMGTKTNSYSGSYYSKNISQVEQQFQKLERELQTANELLAAERKAVQQAEINLWRKEKELSDANLDKRISIREARTAEERMKSLQEEKERLAEKLRKKEKLEEERSSKLMKEIESAKASLGEITRESSRNRMLAESAQKALTQANKQIEELQSSSASLRKELDATRKQIRGNQDRIDNFKAETERLKTRKSEHNDIKTEYEIKLDDLQDKVNSYQVNNELLKETCKVLEEQLTDYERLTNNFETRENTLIQDKMKLQKELEIAETKLRECRIAQNEEKTMRILADREIVKLKSEKNSIGSRISNSAAQKDEYKILAQELNDQISELTTECSNLKYDLSRTKRLLEKTKEDARIVKEESSQHLTKLHELKEKNLNLEADLQRSVDQGQGVRERLAELEGVMDEMRQFYKEREVKAGSTCQQQTKLIDYLQLKLEQCSKKKKGVYDKIFNLKQKENVPPVGTVMPIGYRELESQLEKERAKVKTLTEQLLTSKTSKISSPKMSTTLDSPEQKYSPPQREDLGDLMTRHLSLQRMKHNIPHRFNVSLPMRSGKCAACLDSIQFGRRAAICSECQVMTHLKCSVSVPATCGFPRDLVKKFGKYSKHSLDSSSSLVDSVKTLAIDEPEQPERDTDHSQRNSDAAMESWVKVPNHANSCWERKYLKLEGTSLCIYDLQPGSGLEPISCLDLPEKYGFTISETVDRPDVVGTAKSDLPFVIRVEHNSPTTCWPTSRLDFMALSQLDKKNWLMALRSLSNKPARYQTVLRLEKNQLDLNCVVELPEERVLLLGTEEGLYSYQFSKSKVLTVIRGVKKVHQLTLHPKLGLALMIAGDDRQLVSCDLSQLKNNALAAEYSRPSISTKSVLTSSESCHLYQVQGEMLCAATSSQVILLKWAKKGESGEFIGIRELETQEPCSCALFTKNILIVGCHKFFQIDTTNYVIDDFLDDNDRFMKASLNGVVRLGIFPICVLDVSENPQNVELLLCYNEFGVFVNEKGQRTRNIDPNWSHLIPFAFAYCKPNLFVVHFSSVEIIKLEPNSFRSQSEKPERTSMEFNNPRYLGQGSKGIYLSAVNSVLELMKIEGISSIPRLSGSQTSIDSLSQIEDSTSEFSFATSLIEGSDIQERRKRFGDSSNH